MMGDGIYKSTDAGETWTKMGLPETGRIGTIVVHPTNENIVLVCALGRATGPQKERGVFRTEDGGKTWQQTLFVDQNTGCSGLQMSQQDPNVVIAGTWEIELQTHILYSGGMGSGIHLSRDGGKTFYEDHGARSAEVAVRQDGRRDRAVGRQPDVRADSDGRRRRERPEVEAQGSLWRSDDAGKTWNNVSWDRRLIGRAGYYIRIRVSPDNPDHLMIANSTLWRSRDGGKIWQSGGGGCGDCHDIWWDTTPVMPGHYIVTGDGGMGIFGSPANPAATPACRCRSVRCTASPSISAARTGSTAAGRMTAACASRAIGRSCRRTCRRTRRPHRTGSGASRGRRTWRRWTRRRGRGGGAAGAAAAGGAAGAGAARGGGGGGGEAPEVEGGGGGGRGDAAARRAGRARAGEHAVVRIRLHVSRAEQQPVRLGHLLRRTRRDVRRTQRAAAIGEPVDAHARSDPVGLKYRCHWSPPLAIDWFDNSVYFGCQLILRTRDRGQTWEEISPDLSTNEPHRLLRRRRRRQPRPVLRRRRLGDRAVAHAAGRHLGRHERRQGLDHARRRQELDRPDEEREHAAVGHRAPHRRVALRSGHGLHGGGLSPRRSARSVSLQDDGLRQDVDAHRRELPKGHPLDYALSIAENPQARGMLFAGTGHGFFYSKDDGKTWTQFKDKLPAAPVTWIEVPKNAPEVAVATYGRGLWILRDVWQLEQGAAPAQPAELQLFKPRPGIRSANGGSATFVFSLAPRPPRRSRWRSSTDNGLVLDTNQVRRRAGLNQTSWNLLAAAPARPVLRSLPPDNPHIWDAGRWQNRERPVTHWGLGAASWQPRAAPGKYTCG